MTAENLLQRLNKVKSTGRGKWQACCPAHADKGPSLAIREMDDGRVLLHCFANCGAAEVLDALGLDFSELFPPAIQGNYLPKVRKPWTASDVLPALAFEVLVAWNFTNVMASGTPLDQESVDRLLLCASRLQKGLGVANG